MFLLTEPQPSELDTFTTKPFSDTFTTIKPLYDPKETKRIYGKRFSKGLRIVLPVSISLWLIILLGFKFINTIQF